MSNDDLGYKPRRLHQWMESIGSGGMKLPKFQRSYVWNNRKIRDLLEALLSNRPVGTLLLIPDDPERFASRNLKELNEIRDADSVELILDGQQRLTSLWGAFMGKPELLVRVKDWDDESLQLKGIRTPREVGIVSRSQATETEIYEKGCFPVSILGIDDVTQDDDAGWRWCNKAMKNDGEKARLLWKKIDRSFGEPIRNRDLWYLKLPDSMSREEAIDVYVKTNQSSAVIKKFDIAVALYDSETGASLRDEIIDMIREVSQGGELIRLFFGVGNDDADEEDLIPELGELLLKVACLWTDVPPTETNYMREEVLKTLRKKVKIFREALVRSLEFYLQEGIPRRSFVPSYVPLRVLPALQPVLKQIPQKYNARATRVIRAYLWRSFLTDRYSRSANTRLYDDYRNLREALQNPDKLDVTNLKKIAPIFNEDHFPLGPTIAEMSDLEEPLRRPQLKNTRSRAVFAISLRNAQDFGTGELLVPIAGKDCDRHHLFPKDYLKKNGVTEAKQINHCLNFALLTNKTNGTIRNLGPHDYLGPDSEFIHDNDGNGDNLKNLVSTHQIPFDQLISEPSSDSSGVPNIYQKFIEARAGMIRDAIDKLCQGDTP